MSEARKKRCVRMFVFCVVLAATLSTGAGAADAGEADGPSAIGAARLIPEEMADAPILFSFDLGQLHEMKAFVGYDKIIELACRQFKRPNYLEKAGFSVERDFRGISGAIVLPGETPLPDVVIVGAGSFKRDAIYEVLKDVVPDLEPVTVGGEPAFAVEVDNLSATFGILGDSLVFLATEGWAEKVVAQWKNGAGEVPPRLARLQGAMRLTIAPEIIPEEAWEIPQLQMIQLSPENVKALAVEADLIPVQTVGMEGRVRLQFDTHQNAQQVHTALVGAINMARAAAPLAQLLTDQIELSSKDGEVVVSGKYAQNMHVAQMGMLAGMMMPALSAARREAKKANCMSNLRQIGIARIQYFATYGQSPPSLKAMLDDDIMWEPEVFVCPSDRSAPDEGWHCSYSSIFEMTKIRLPVNLPDDLPIAWDKECFHGDGRCVLFKDGHVDFVREADFPKILDAAKKHVEEVEKQNMERAK